MHDELWQFFAHGLGFEPSNHGGTTQQIAVTAVTAVTCQALRPLPTTYFVALLSAMTSFPIPKDESPGHEMSWTFPALSEIVTTGGFGSI